MTTNVKSVLKFLSVLLIMGGINFAFYTIVIGMDHFGQTTPTEWVFGASQHPAIIRFLIGADAVVFGIMAYNHFEGES